MPIYQFTSPAGVDYYGEGASPEDAFRTAEERDPAEIAAMRQRQAVKPSGGRGESEFTGQVEDFLVPGLGAAKSAMGGEFGEAAGKAALSAAPFGLGKVPAAAKALGAGAATLMAPSATAGGMFDAEADPKVRRSLQKQYDEAGPKGKREITAAFMAQQGKIAEERRGVERETAERGETQKRRDDWMAQNADAIGKMSKDRQDQIKGASSLTQAQDLFTQGMEEHRQAGLTWAEKHPDEMEYLQVGAAGLSGLGPIYQAWRRSRTLTKSAEEAEKAFEKAMKSRAPKGAKEQMAWRANLAEELDQINDPGFLKAVAKSALIGGSVSSFAMQTPNLVDMASHPAGSEAREKAKSSLSDPENWLRAGGEGALGAAAGRGLAEKFGSLPAARSRNKAIADTIRQQQAAELAAKEAKAQAKLAPKRGSKPTLVPPPTNVLSPSGGGDVLAPNDPLHYGYAQ